MAFAVVALISGQARASELLAANGITGAGTRSDDAGRAWAELGFSARDEEAVAWTHLGLGLRPARWLEVEAQLPVGYTLIEREYTNVSSGDGDGDSPVWLGNPYIGANLLALDEPGLRWRFGAGFTLPLTGVEQSDSDVRLLPLQAAGNQDPHLWRPGGVSIVGRGRLEVDTRPVTLSFDLASVVMLRVWDYGIYPSERTTVLYLQPAVEVLGHVSADTLVGARLPLIWGTLDEEFSLSIVPFLRQALGASLFAEAIFTLNVVGPEGIGPSSDGPIWGMQLGLGASF